MFRFRHHNQSLFRSEMNVGNVHVDYCLPLGEKGTRINSRKQYNVFSLKFRNSIANQVKYSKIVLNNLLQWKYNVCMCCTASDPAIRVHLLTSRCPRTPYLSTHILLHSGSECRAARGRVSAPLGRAAASVVTSYHLLTSSSTTQSNL